MKRIFSLLLAVLLAGSMQVVAQETGIVLRLNGTSDAGTIVYDSVANLKMSCKNSAKVQSIGKYNVINLGTSNGYLDMTSKAGAVLQSLNTFSISCYYRVADASDITTSGNFLWAFSTSTACTSTSGIYHAYRLNTQRIATSTGGYSNETGYSVGTTSTKGKWVHVVYTQTESGLGTLYVDGVKKGTVSSVPAPNSVFTSAPTYCWMGRAPFSADNYLKQTLIYGFTIYNKVLTQTEITEQATLLDDLDHEYRYGTVGDFTALKTAVESAEAYLKTAQSSGKYPQAAIEDYQDVVTYSRNILDQATVNQEIIDAQVTALSTAKTRLNATSGFSFSTDGIDMGYDTERGFRHPGGLHTAADFERVRQQLANGNAKVTAAYNILKNAEYAQSTTATYPVVTVIRGGSSGENYMNAARGAAIAYQNALRWQIEGNKKCAQHAVDVLMAWARTTTGIGGDSNFALAAGLYGYEFAQAAELVRDYDGWSEEDFSTFCKWMIDVWYGSSMDFLRRRNDCWANSSQWWQAPGAYWSNWGLCNALCIISIGVLCDDVNIYNQGMSFIKYDQTGNFNGIDATPDMYGDAIMNNMLTEFWGALVVDTYPWDKETGAYGKVGQMNESGRDGGHCGMAVGMAVDVAKQGYNQGDDLFSYMDHRLAAGIEYVAAQSQNQDDLPWENYWYITNGIFCSDSRCWKMTGPAMGAQIRPIWGTIIGIYEGVKGVKMPWAEKAYATMGIDGGGAGSTSGGYDHLGYSVLMNTRDSIADREKAPVELQAHLTYNGKTIDHNELGMLTNTYNITAEKSRALAKGTVVTFSPTLPDTIQDTGNWRWDTGETTRELTITANESHIYRVHYTNPYGVESEQSYAIAVQGDCQPTTLRPAITVQNVNVGSTEATVSYGSNVTLFLNPRGGYGNFEWENGQTTSSITLGTVTHDRTITGCFVSQTSRRCYVTFTIHVTPIIPSVTIGTATQSVYGEIYANQGDDITLNAPVAEALEGGNWMWENGLTANSMVIDSIQTSQSHTVSYTVNGTTYTQDYSILVNPTTPELMEPGTYSIRLRGTDLYLTAYEKGDTAIFAKPDIECPNSQIWYIYRSSQKNPYYSLCSLQESTFMSIQGIQVSNGSSRPHRLVFAIGTNYAYWYITSSNVNYYVGVDSESGKITMNGNKEFNGYPFEIVPVTSTDIENIQDSTSKNQNSSAIYNLSGQRVSTMQHGQIYIVNGKKILYR